MAVDEHATNEWLVGLGWSYGGGAEGASLLLSTVAGSMIAIAGTVFSMTLVVLSLASSQLGPRLLRNFMRDTINQVVLGTFVATFVYCLLVLRTIRRADETAFVPHLAVGIGVLLAHLKESRALIEHNRLIQDLRSTTSLIARDLRRAGHWADSGAGVWLRETRQAIHEEVEAATRVAEQWLKVLVPETLADGPQAHERLIDHLGAIGRIRANRLVHRTRWEGGDLDGGDLVIDLVEMESARMERDTSLYRIVTAFTAEGLAEAMAIGNQVPDVVAQATAIREALDACPAGRAGADCRKFHRQRMKDLDQRMRDQALDFGRRHGLPVDGD